MGFSLAKRRRQVMRSSLSISYSCWWWWRLSFLSLATNNVLDVVLAQRFIPQNLGIPYLGEHTGVASADLNNDGYNDIIISAGRHSIDQSFALINLGRQQRDTSYSKEPNEEEEEEEVFFRFSNALPIGNPGGYYQADTSKLSSINPNHTAILLAGGICTMSPCTPGYATPAVLLDVVVTGCSVFEPEKECSIEWTELWQDPDPQGDRNGALAMTLGDGLDPAIIVVGNTCTAIFRPMNGTYGNATSVINPPVKGENVNRGTGLAVGTIGGLPGVVIGTRTHRTRGPAPPIVGIVKLPGGDDLSYYTLDEGEQYGGSSSNKRRPVGLQPVGLALGDIDGDGLSDLVVANYIEPFDVIPGFPIPQRFYHLDSGGFGSSKEVFETYVGGRSVDVGQIFNHSALPDIVYGTADSTVHFFANLGNRHQQQQFSRSTFRGFAERFQFEFPDLCEVRDTIITSLDPCSTSVICVLLCTFNTGDSTEHGHVGNFAFHSFDPTCSIPTPVSPITPPSVSPTDMPSELPSDMPTVNPTNLPTSIAADERSNKPKVAPVPQEEADARNSFHSFDPTHSSLTSRSPTTMPPSNTQTYMPSELQSKTPSAGPTMPPRNSPTDMPSTLSPVTPSVHPTMLRRNTPTEMPKETPPDMPFVKLTGVPTSMPTSRPTSTPTSRPTSTSTSTSTSPPTSRPKSTSTSPPTSRSKSTSTSAPTAQPSYNPSFNPTSYSAAYSGNIFHTIKLMVIWSLLTLLILF